MSTNSLYDGASLADSAPVGGGNPLPMMASTLRLLAGALASLRLTVALFALAIFLIYVGTLAQVEKDVWEVVQDYFRSWAAWVDLQVFLPTAFFPNLAPVAGGFWFPGGCTIGAAMAANLLAAHLVRFRLRACGPLLVIGSVTLLAGIVVTWLIIASGHNSTGQQSVPRFSWETLWGVMRASLAVIALTAAVVLVVRDHWSSFQRFALVAAATILGGLSVSLYARGPSAMPSPASLRILWQLLEGGVAGLILLSGCVMVFGKRAGIVLLHGGIGLMMFSEFFVSQYAVEGRMTIREGETVNYVRDIRTVELAVIDASAEQSDEVVNVPKELIRRGNTIRDDVLPFDIHVNQFFQNARLRDVESNDVNWADTGMGKRLVAEAVRAVSGTDPGSQVDMAAVYVDLKQKGTDTSLGKYLLSQILTDQGIAENVQVADRAYDVSLRFKRTYKDYKITLIDFRKDDYLGTDTPRNYSSDVRVVDAANNVDLIRKIWMNNPLRYAGETFYQSGYHVGADGVEATVLQVVTNTGWMMPYVGCMLVAVGMLAHFSATLVRFVHRGTPSEHRNDLMDASANNPSSTESATGRDIGRGWIVPALVVSLFAGGWMTKLIPPTDTKNGMRMHDFGRIPVVYQGRVKPLDTLARNSLRVVSNRETFVDQDGNRQPAIRWLLDVISDSDDAAEHQVFRIENLDVLDVLGLPRRKGLRYAINEFRGQIAEFERQAAEARKLEVQRLSVYQKKLLELERRIHTFNLLQASFRTNSYPPVPTEEEFRSDPGAAGQRLEQIESLLQDLPRSQQMLARMQPPLAVPVGGEDEWLPYTTAVNNAYLRQQLLGEQPSLATLSWSHMLAAYAEGNTMAFNDTVAQYHASLLQHPPNAVKNAKVPFEVIFNNLQPFQDASFLYVVAFILVALSWLLHGSHWHQVLNRSAFCLIIVTLCLHTFAIVARMMISGRPPVTNLYSSAVFIGWAAVLLGVILELTCRIGIGNVIATVAGFTTLLIAGLLAGDGDTFTVLQAVLDTQFWLATHVVCVTLGYSTTFVAGLLGAIYILMRTKSDSALGKEIARMIYGTLCFAMFFSFVGTVLGGLWADDSWGRFWGWDPKENGALMIVLWNALILHARWGAMVRQRGLAVLAVVGNVITSWSWFGVNELGVGLHSYGFTEGVLLALGIFVASQLALVALGTVPYFVKSPQEIVNA